MQKSFFDFKSKRINRVLRYCLLVGDQKSIKRGKEVINELLNLSAPANTDTAAAAQPKGAPKSAKPSPSVPKTKKLPPLPRFGFYIFQIRSNR